MSQPPEPDDQQGQGDGQTEPEAVRAFEALARQVIEPVRRYLARRTDDATAADVVSEVLLVIWRRLEEVPAEAALPYAYTVARNCLHNAQRSAVRQQRLAVRVAALDPPAHAVPAHHEHPEDLPGSWGVDELDVHRAIDALPAASAEVVRLWAWEELSPAQIAVVVGSSPNAVSIRLHRAKKQLAQTLAPPIRPAAGPPTSPPSDSPSRHESGGGPGRGHPPDHRPDQRADRDRRTP